MDDTTRGVGPGGEFRGRGDETTRNYASTPETTTGPSKPPSRTSESTRSARADSDLDAETDRRTREIQGEIAHTRAELSETIDALQERLRPGNIVSDATEKVKTATTERVRSMADTASGTAQGIMEGARQNPIPALMIGAGVAWMLYDRTRQRGNGRYLQRAEWPEYSAPRDGISAESDEYYRETYGTRPSSGRSWSGQRSEGVTSWARQATGEARHTARRAQNGLQRMLHENPLLVGAAAMLVGAAVGASLPETETENEWMGEARDSVVERAQEAARNATEAVKDVSKDVVGDTVTKVTDRVTGGKQK
jgi:hypothetical protein